jgi:hypothetical protein
LEVGDICTLSNESLKKIYFKFLPVLVKGVTTAMKCNGTKYLVASKHQHIKGSFSRGQLHYREQYTVKMLQINTEVQVFKKLSLQEARETAQRYLIVPAKLVVHCAPHYATVVGVTTPTAHYLRTCAVT